MWLKHRGITSEWPQAAQLGTYPTDHTVCPTVGGCTIPQKRPVMSVCLSHLEKCDTSSFEQPEQQIRAIIWIAFCKYYNYVSQQSIILA